MIDQEQVARTLINLIDVVHQENWVLLNTKDMAKQTEDYFIRFFSEHGKAEATDEIKEVTQKNQAVFDRITSVKELNAKEMRDFLWNPIVLKTKYIHQSKFITFVFVKNMLSLYTSS